MLKRGLGRGFESLIPTQLLEEEFDPTRGQDEKELKDIKIEQVVPNPHQPRATFDEAALQELANSIKEHGVVQPIVVTQKGSDYELVAGERRLRASKLAGLTKIPAIVRSYTDQTKLELALIENLQREDLNALEIATAYLKLNQQFNLSYRDISVKAGKALSTVSNTLRLLGLPKTAKSALINGEITEGHARQILAIQEPTVQQELLDLIVKNAWTVRKAEQFVIGYKEGKKDRVVAAAKVLTETDNTKAIGSRIKAKVTIRHMAKGGQLIIRFKDENDLQRISSSLLS